MPRRPFVWMIITALMTVAGSVWTADAATTIRLPDRALAECVLHQVDDATVPRPRRDFTPSELDRVTDLSCVGVRDLTGIGSLHNVTQLWLTTDNETAYSDHLRLDLEPLRSLAQVAEFSLEGYDPTHLDAVTGWNRLRTFRITSGELTSLAGLSGIRAGVALDLNVAAMADDWESLGRLSELTDLTMLGRPGPLAPLARLTHLQRLLIDTGDHDLDPLSDLDELNYLLIGGNYPDLDALVGLPRLRTLFVQDVNDDTIDSLARMTQLRDLQLRDGFAAVSSLSPLSRLTGLTSFGSDLIRIGDGQFDALTAMSDLQHLWIRIPYTDRRTFDVEPLGTLSKLETLTVLSYGPFAVRDLQPLRRLTSLTLNGPGVTSIAGLPTLTDGAALSVDDSVVTDLGPIADSGASLASLGIPGSSDFRTLAGVRARKITSGIFGSHRQEGFITSIDGLQDVIGLQEAEFGSYGIRDTSMIPCSVRLELDRQYVELSAAKVGVPVAFPVRVQGGGHVAIVWGSARYDDDTIVYTRSSSSGELVFSAQPCDGDGSTVEIRTQADVAANPDLKEFRRTYFADPEGVYATGQKLTAKVKAWKPAPDRYSYQWLRDDQPIPGATATSYVLVSADQGHRIRVKVTGDKKGYVETDERGNYSDVVQARAVATSVPAISGATQVGRTLTASPGTWTAGTHFDFQWLRNGSPINTQIDDYYVLTAADLGKTISVRVIGSKDGYATVARTSTATRTVTRGAITAGRPSVSGTMKPGKKIRAVTGTWAPTGLKFSYRWLRNGKSIPGATSASYTLKSKDAGKKISVKISATKSSYATKTKTSAARKVQG